MKVPHIMYKHLNPGESVVLFMRKHPIIIWRSMVWLVIAGLIPLAGWIFIITQTVWGEDPENIWRLVALMVVSIFYLLWSRQLFLLWLNYYLDVWMVTTDRILYIDQKGVFERFVSELRLARIQDVTTHTKGFLQTMLHFGNIHVQTAAETEPFIFEDVPHPEVVTQEISRLQHVAVMSEQHDTGTEAAERMRPHVINDADPAKKEFTRSTKPTGLPKNPPSFPKI